MGLGIFRSSSSCSIGSSPTPTTNDRPLPNNQAPDRLGNPDPRRFTIVRHLEYVGPTGSRTVVEATYPDAKNYEGRKVMLYRCAYAEVAKQKTLDPHFCDDGGHLSPFARFEPTSAEWMAAVTLAHSV